MMRRSLVLSSESARHWFRAALPQRRRLFGDVAMPAGAPALTPQPPVRDWRLTAGDMRGAVSVYFATVAAVLAFIA